MSKALKSLLLLAVALAGTDATGNDPNSGSQWPTQPFWFMGGPPAGRTQNTMVNPFAYGGYPPTQNAGQQNWLLPYAYQQFGLPAPFGYAPVHPQMLYGGYPPPNQPVPGIGANVPPSPGESDNMAVDSPAQPCVPGLAQPSMNGSSAGPSRLPQSNGTSVNDTMPHRAEPGALSLANSIRRMGRP